MTDHDPVDELLADLRTDVPEMSDRAFAAGRARLQAVTEAAPVVTTLEPVATKSRKRRRPELIAAAAAVVALVAGVLVVQTVRSGDRVPAAGPVRLDAVADRVDVPDVPLGPGQYRHIVTHSWDIAPPQVSIGNTKGAYLEETVRQLWLSADPAEQCLVDKNRTGRYKRVARDATKAEASRGPALIPGSVESQVLCGDFPGGSWQQPSTGFAASVPRDPGQLYDRLRRDADPRWPDPDLNAFVLAAEALGTGQLPADLRAALYRALALVPGVGVTEQVADLDGAKGTAIGISRLGVRQDVIIDTATGEFIGERHIDLDGVTGAPSGSVISYSTVSAPEIVEKKPTG
jgi:hypothetical protein